MMSFAPTNNASAGRKAHVGQVLGAAVLALAMSVSLGAQAGELDRAQPEDVLSDVNAVVDEGLNDERGAGFLDRERATGDQESGVDTAEGRGGVIATARGAGTAVGVSITGGNLSVAISNNTVNQTVTQTTTIGGGGTP